MNPLMSVDTSQYQPHQLVNPLWDDSDETYGENHYQLMVYLSKSPKFTIDFIKADLTSESTVNKDYQNHENDRSSPTLLVWSEMKSTKGLSNKLSKYFVITTNTKNNDNCDTNSEEVCTAFQQKQTRGSSEPSGINLETAISWFDEKSSFSLATSSVFIALYNYASSLFGSILPSSNDQLDASSKKDVSPSPQIINLHEKSPIWENIMNNRTVYAHALLMRNPQKYKIQSPPENISKLKLKEEEFKRLVHSNSVILGSTNLIKHDAPIPTKPTRILSYDLIYLFKRYILQKTDLTAPWDHVNMQPIKFQNYQRALSDKENGVGYSYWKPEVSARLVSDSAQYPIDIVDSSHMEIVQLARSRQSAPKEHPSGFGYLPPMYVDEMGLTSEKYIPVNGTVSAFPLRISFDSSHGEEDDVSSKDEENQMSIGKIAGGKGLSESVSLTPQRWRLLSHMAAVMEGQRQTGLFEESDIDDMKRLIADTNVLLLGITMLASGLHLLFEFLTFKSEVEFWKENTDLTGLSVRALFLDVMSQTIVLAYLMEMDSSLLMTIPQAVGILIAMWKCHRAAGFKLVRSKTSEDKNAALISFAGFELHATRLTLSNKSKKVDDKLTKNKDDKKQDLVALTIETDRIATSTLGRVLIPLVVIYAVYTLANDEYSGWYTWLITTASSAVYALGFALMTPQLFLNYKLKSVAHLPWRVLCYRFINTFIDDLFAFIIRMPTMARISCFRDDVVFVIYLFQRYYYPVDKSRPVEGGGNIDDDKEDKPKKE